MLKKSYYISLLFLFMSPMTVIAQNNIQRYFLGLNFMDHYGNAYTALTKISAKYSNQSIPSLDNIILYDLPFGGVIWNHAILTFDVIKSESSSRSYFYAIDFNNPYSDLDDAYKCFVALYDNLSNKYWSVDINEDYMNKVAVWGDNATICCLALKYSEAMNGEMYWYVALSYWDIDTVDRHTANAVDEL